MGRGDKRSRRGKIFKGSYGNSRKQSAGSSVVKKASPSSATSSTAAKKAPATKKSKG
ncbi:MAG: 30S ribosomal protein THX [Pseudomonadota bacterium]|jgi:30S ribosomal protein S31